jgi:hypothetical protein
MMKNFIALAAGLILLVSAASATGNGNTVYTDIYAESIGNCITGGVTLAQVANADSYLLGNENNVCQDQSLWANDNSLTGMFATGGNATNNTMSIVSQMSRQVANATGSYNDEYQDLCLDLSKNCLVGGNMTMTQMALQTEDIIGCDNNFSQTTVSTAEYNDLIMGGDFMQVSDLSGCANGSENVLMQDVYQDAWYNCLTDSSLGQMAALDSNSLGSYNDVNQAIEQWADCNSATMGMINQGVLETSDLTGSDNYVDQFGETDAFDNCLTEANILQSITEAAVGMGCDNLIDQNVHFNTCENSITGGTLIQDSTVISND